MDSHEEHMGRFATDLLASHEEHMGRFATDLLASKKSSLVSYERFQVIMNHLNNPQDTIDPNTKHWIKHRGFQFMDLPGFNVQNALVVPAKEKKSRKVDSDSGFLKVVHMGMVYQIVNQIHQDQFKHSGYKKVLDYVSRYYYGITRGYIQEFCKTCPTCQLGQPKKTKPLLRPIIESDFLSRVQIDLIDMQNTPDGEFKFICHFVDHFTKYHVIFPLKNKCASEVAQQLEERVLAYLGTPRILHTDDEREFDNRILSALMDQWEGDVTFVRGGPCHTQSQGLVERGNQVIRNKLGAIKEDLKLDTGDSFHWARHLPRIMFAMNTQVCETTKTSPFEAVFGQEANCAAIVPEMGSAVLYEEDICLQPYVSVLEETTEEQAGSHIQTRKRVREATEEC